jgi:ATP-dependent Lon protease
MKSAQDLENRVRNEMQRERAPLALVRKPTDQFSGDSFDNEMNSLEKRIKDANLPEKVLEEIVKEFKRLKSLRGQSSEANVIRTYIETVVGKMPCLFIPTALSYVLCLCDKELINFH